MSDSAKVIRLEPESQRQVRARLARLPAVIHGLNDVGQKFLASALEAYFDAADDALFDLADKAQSNNEQNAFFDSMREVRVQRKSVERRFFEMIDDAFSRLAGDDVRVPAKPNGELSAEALSLVQNEDLEQLVALESTVSRAMREYSAVLSGVAEALSRILPVEINEQKVPLSPAVICAAIMAQIKRLDIDIKAKLVLFKLFDRLVVSRQSELNQQMLECLEESGIRVTLGRRVVAETAAPEVPDLAAPRAEDIVSVEDLGPAEGMVSTENAVSAPEMASLVSAAGSGMQNRTELLKLLSFVQRLPITGDSANGLDFERVLASVLNRRGESVDFGRLEKETMGLVQMLFRFILREQDLAEPFRELIGRMQIPVLKMALLDQQFLVEKRHPARRLLNELVAVAAEWQKGDTLVGDEPLLKFMRSTIDRIQSQFDSNPDVFKDALADFTSFVDKEKRRAAVLERRTIDAEDGKGRAEQARKTVAREIQLRTLDQALPELVLALINGPWSNVLFVTGLKYGFSSAEWNDQLRTLTDLVWSVQPCASKSERQKLIRLIPDLIGRLRKGLDSISYNPFEVAELFTGLEEIHLARIRGELLAHEKPAEEVAPAPESRTAEPIVTALEQASAPEQATNPEHAATSKQATARPELSPDDPHMMMVQGLAQGAWFDLQEGEGKDPLRCRLAAFIRPTGKYIFVNRSGIKVAEKTQLELALAMKTGYMRALDHSMLFDRALETVVTSLRQAKAKTPLDLDGNKS